MSTKYDFRATEQKWQERWRENGLFTAPEAPDADRKFYLLEMFAYPSGDIHMGHFRNYGIGDAVCRYLLMNGRQVLHPYGWDAFGLPAENAAIQRGTHPREWTRANIATGGDTLRAVGMGYDWSREFATCNPDFYRWTQWIFQLLHRRGLAYRKDAPVNWCDDCNTGLANAQVQDGKCWRCGNEVRKRDLEQWYIKITDYAQRLHDGLDDLPAWPNSTYASQRNWIGRSEGATIRFEVADAPADCPQVLEVFTTRPDTVWGATFMAVAPESAFGRYCAESGPNAAAVAAYAAEAANKTEIERSAANREKTGVKSGFLAVHPCTGDAIPILVADYVLAGYGTGYVMAVPAHDERDFAFAKAHDLPIRVVIQDDSGELAGATLEAAHTGAGPMVNSGPFDGRDCAEAMSDLIAWLEEQEIGAGKVNFRLRDWLISRQRYWGCPIPMIHCDACGVVPVPEDQLPVLLPENIENWVPKGRSPLADVPEFMNVACPECGGAAQRDPDTMDTFIDSAWYHLRYVDPKNETALFSPEYARAWLPVDLYIGGAEHANGHLIYFRFITKVLKDEGLLDVEEPVTRLYHHGMVSDEDGRPMSKSLGNVISPIHVCRDYGIDAARVAMFFFAPSDEEIAWKPTGVAGARKLVQRLFATYSEYAEILGAHEPNVRGMPSACDDAREVRRRAHVFLDRMTRAFEKDLALNTAVAAIYEFLNVLPAASAAAEADENDQCCYAEALRVVALGMAPLMPHLAEQIHEMLGGEGSVFAQPWPSVDQDALSLDEIEIAVQVRGKVKARVTIAADAPEEVVKMAALADPDVQAAIGEQKVKRVIVVPGRLVNVVV